MTMTSRCLASRVPLMAAFFVLVALPARAAEIQDVLPRILSVETRTLPPSGPPVEQHFAPREAETAALPSFHPPRITARFEIQDTAQVNTPFRIRLWVFDENGFPTPRHAEAVTYECELGVVPVVSSARWLNGLLEDTLIITAPGRHVRLTAVTGDAVSSVYLDVAPPPFGRAQWIRVAEERLAAGRFADGVSALQNAALLTQGGDAEIENRLGRLFLERGEWHEAETHFRSAVRSAVNNAP